LGFYKKRVCRDQDYFKDPQLDVVSRTKKQLDGGREGIDFGLIMIGKG